LLERLLVLPEVTPHGDPPPQRENSCWESASPPCERRCSEPLRRRGTGEGNTRDAASSSSLVVMARKPGMGGDRPACQPPVLQGRGLGGRPVLRNSARTELGFGPGSNGGKALSPGSRSRSRPPH